MIKGLQKCKPFFVYEKNAFEIEKAFFYGMPDRI